MLSDQEKQNYNEVVKARCQLIAEKPLDTRGFMAIRYYDEKMYCREPEECQELTNQAFIFKLWKIEEMLGMDPSKGGYVVIHIPLCDKHIQQRVAYSKIEQGGEI